MQLNLPAVPKRLCGYNHMAVYKSDYYYFGCRMRRYLRCRMLMRDPCCYRWLKKTAQLVSHRLFSLSTRQICTMARAKLLDPVIIKSGNYHVKRTGQWQTCGQRTRSKFRRIYGCYVSVAHSLSQLRRTKNTVFDIQMKIFLLLCQITFIGMFIDTICA